MVSKRVPASKRKEYEAWQAQGAQECASVWRIVPIEHIPPTSYERAPELDADAPDADTIVLVFSSRGASMRGAIAASAQSGSNAART